LSKTTEYFQKTIKFDFEIRFFALGRLPVAGGAAGGAAGGGRARCTVWLGVRSFCRIFVFFSLDFLRLLKYGYCRTKTRYLPGEA
jgi:hypothetical protein